MKDQVFGVLQRIGRSFMLPIALLPAAGLLLGIGGSFSNVTMLKAYGLTRIMGPGTFWNALFMVMSRAGDIVFTNLPILFAMGVAIGMAKKEKIWGGIRDVEQMKKVPDVQVYYRGIDPTPIREFVMKDWNDITNFGGAVCLPGDIVFGAGGGVLFIPAHLVADVVEGAAKTHVKDDFGFEMICQGKFTTAQIDKNTWTEEMLDMLLDWIKTDPRGEEYRDLDWSKEYDLARNGDPNDTQTAL